MPKRTRIYHVDPSRQCLPLALWPAADRTAWDGLFVEGDVASGRERTGCLHPWYRIFRRRHRSRLPARLLQLPNS